MFAKMNRNSGADVGVNFKCSEQCRANIHVGYAGGGTLRIANGRDDLSTHYKFEGAAYLGGELWFCF